MTMCNRCRLHWTNTGARYKKGETSNEKKAREANEKKAIEATAADGPPTKKKKKASAPTRSSRRALEIDLTAARGKVQHKEDQHGCKHTDPDFWQHSIYAYLYTNPDYCAKHGKKLMSPTCVDCGVLHCPPAEEEQ